MEGFGEADGDEVLVVDFLPQAAPTTDTTSTAATTLNLPLPTIAPLVGRSVQLTGNPIPEASAGPGACRANQRRHRSPRPAPQRGSRPPEAGGSRSWRTRPRCSARGPP